MPVRLHHLTKSVRLVDDFVDELDHGALGLFTNHYAHARAVKKSRVLREYAPGASREMNKKATALRRSLAVLSPHHGACVFQASYRANNGWTLKP